MRGRRSDRPTASRAAATPRWLAVLGFGIALGIVTIGIAVLATARQDDGRRASEAAQNLVLALDREISRNIKSLGLSVQGVIEALAEPGIDFASPGVRQYALFDRSSNADDLGSILVLDAAGQVVERSNPVEAIETDLSEREFFRVHRDSPDLGLHVSRPFRTGPGAEDFSIAISQRRPTADGGFGGVVAGTLRLSYFRSLFTPLNIGSQGSISVFTLGGRMVARTPFRLSDVDRDLSGADTVRHMISSPGGQYVGRAAIDGVQRLYTFRRVSDVPLVLTVSMSIDEIYAGWWKRATTLGPALLLLCLALVLLCALVRQEMGRRQATERDLAEAVEELKVLATIDALTGLANRRTFEARLQTEWKRALRTGSTVSVLMIDVDAFKSFNDAAGHQEGDKVLRAVARCLAESVRRPADLLARYGGEEFVAVLPDTDRAGALTLAERMRTGLESLRIPHPAAPGGRVTVSIGVASHGPARSDRPGDLVSAADGALYEAKRGGRNRSVLARSAEERLAA